MLFVLFLAHLPFLQYDPDQNVDLHTRGAWTDEGLYASQTLNFLERGKLDLYENSTFVRGPLLNILQLPFFVITGPHRLTARLIVLISLLFALWFFASRKGMGMTILFFIPVSFLQYQLFHFSHYAMAEMLCVSAVLVSLGIFITAVDKGGKAWKKLLIAAFFLFVAYGMKIQYLYLAAILPLASGLNWLVALIRREQETHPLFRVFVISTGFTLMWAMIYLLFWYLPNQDFYQYIMGSEVSGRYKDSLEDMWKLTRFNIEHFIWCDSTKAVITGFLLAIVLLPFFGIRKSVQRSGIIFAIAWLILELHKLPMTYLPQRYLLSLYAVMGLFIAFLLSSLWRRRAGRWVSVLILGAIFAFHVPNYLSSLENRSDDLGKVNDYLAQYDLEGEVILGPWAASLSWGTHAITKPVWNGYFNYQAPIETHKPVMVISEKNEAESDKAYSSQGIVLEEAADSVRIFNVWRYEIGIYWISPGS